MLGKQAKPIENSQERASALHVPVELLTESLRARSGRSAKKTDMSSGLCPSALSVRRYRSALSVSFSDRAIQIAALRAGQCEADFRQTKTFAKQPAAR
jgi:hypothetical protein